MSKRNKDKKAKLSPMMAAAIKGNVNELAIIKQFLANLRVLRGMKKTQTRQDLKRSILMARTISEIYEFLTVNYFKDTNTSFDLYAALTDSSYFEKYAMGFMINNRVNDLYFKPRNIQIIFNKDNGSVEAVFNCKEHVDLYYGAFNSSEAHSLLTHAAMIRRERTSHYNALVKEMGAVPVKAQLESFTTFHVVKTLCEEPQAVYAKWILENDVPLTVEDFEYLFNSDFAMRQLIANGYGGVDFESNPNKYDPVAHARMREQTEERLQAGLEDGIQFVTAEDAQKALLNINERSM